MSAPRLHRCRPTGALSLTCDQLVTYLRRVTDDDRVFKALADPTRRFLLDLLFARDGRTLTELESELEMTRFGVMKHLRVLEEAGLVVTRRSGREKLHFLNPVPIRLIHDRWIDKYTERQVTALADLKTELEETTHDHDTTDTRDRDRGRPRRSTGSTSRPPPQAIWDAITKPEWTNRYGYTGFANYDLRPGGAYEVRANEEFRAQARERGGNSPGRHHRRRGDRGRPAAPPGDHVPDAHGPGDRRRGGSPASPTRSRTWDGVLLADPHPRARRRADARLARQRLAGGLQGAGGGHAWVLSDLKSLLETGSTLAG